MLEENDSTKIEKELNEWGTLFSNILIADGRTRGQAIEAATRPLTETTLSDCDSTVRFIFALESFAQTIERLDERKKFLGFFRKSFHVFLTFLKNAFECLASEDKISIVLNINKLFNTYWGNAWSGQERLLLEGQIHEYLSDHVNIIMRSIELELSRAAFEKAQARTDAERVARKKQDAVLNSPVQQISGMPLPEKQAEMIHESFVKNMSIWQELTSIEKIYALVTDRFGLCLDAIPEEQIPNTMEDILGPFGGIVSQQVSFDGRTSKNFVPSSKSQIQDAVHLTLQYYILEQLSIPLQEWLNVSETEKGNDGLTNTILNYQMALRILKRPTYFSDSILEGIGLGIQLFIQKHYRLALSLWLPLFEGALRNVLYSKGEWLINPKEVDGLEQYVGLEKLIGRANKYFRRKTVLFWHKWFSTEGGLGLNLRNDHCHGIMLSDTYCEWIATGTLIAFFFLAQSTELSLSDEDSTE